MTGQDKLGYSLQHEGNYIWQFQYPHRIGSVCMAPCAECHESPEHMGRSYGSFGKEIPKPVLKIVREATYKEYYAFVLAKDGRMVGNPRLYEYFYEVSTD